MKVIDSFEYKRAKKEVKELKTLLTQLDTVADMLYNNISRKGVWDLLMKLEEVRLENYILFHEYSNTIKQGKKNVK